MRFKCLSKRDDSAADVAYLPIDPSDTAARIKSDRINSQSGRVAWRVRRDYGRSCRAGCRSISARRCRDWLKTARPRCPVTTFLPCCKTYLSTADRWQLGDYQSPTERIRRPSGNPAWSPGRGRPSRQRRCCRCLRAGHGALSVGISCWSTLSTPWARVPMRR